MSLATVEVTMRIQRSITELAGETPLIDYHVVVPRHQTSARYWPLLLVQTVSTVHRF